jgi:hypothetical protein
MASVALHRVSDRRLSTLGRSSSRCKADAQHKK